MLVYQRVPRWSKPSHLRLAPRTWCLAMRLDKPHTTGCDDVHLDLHGQPQHYHYIYILLYYIIYSTYHMSFFQHSQNNPEAYFILIQVVVQWSVCHPMVHSKVSETQRIQHDFPPWWFIPLSKLSENPSYQWIDPTCPTKAGISTASENHNPSESIIPRNSVSITIGPTVLISKHQPLETSQVLKLPIPSRGDASIFQVIRSWGSPRALRN